MRSESAKNFGKFLSVVVFGTWVTVLAGCAGAGGGGSVGVTGGGTTSAAVLGGKVYGGSQPISNAAVQLWSAGTTGYGSAGTMLASTMTSGTGTFSVSGTYTCPSSTALLYLTVTGGNPGLPSGTNAQIGLMAALGACGTVVSNPPTVVINEATTVASVYALAPFMSASGSVGSYASNTVGITNAFAMVNNLVNISTGSILSVTPGGNGVVPQNELNTLADILASCVNSSGGAAGSSTNCGSLLTDATPSGGTTPANTLQAALDIAQSPENGSKVGALWGLTMTSGPFQPTLTAAPHDWTVALAYSNSMTDGLSVAIDGSGNVWSVSDQGGSGFVSEVSPTGSNLVQNFTYHGGDAVAIDTQGNAWVVNAYYSQVDEYLPNGNTSAGPFTGNGLSSPKGAAIDGSDNLWIASSGNNTVEELSLSGGSGNYSFTSGNSGYSAGGLSTPKYVAIDESGNAWVANASTVTGLTSSGTAISGSPYTATGGGFSPTAVAPDGSGHIWVSNGGNSELVKLTDISGTVGSTVLTPTGVTSGPGVAVDGGGNVWVVNSGSGGLSEVTAAGVAVNSSGYQGGGMTTPVAMAIDPSGDVWVTNANPTQTGALSTALTEFVGVAVPAVTPIATALANKQVGSEPGAPVPVTIVSGVVPYYTVGQSYQAQLYATGGNSGTFTWSLATGSAALPNGLTLSSTGLISGTTSVASSTTVTVQVADAANTSNTATKSFTLTPVSGLTALGNESALTGSYAVLINTFHNNVQSGLVEGRTLVGSMTFNGSGTISGELDYNDKSNATSENVTFTGYYTYSSGNRGTLVLVPNVSGATPTTFAFSGGTLSGSTPQTLRLQEFDDTYSSGTNGNGQMGSGVGKLQSSAAFVAGTLNQSFVFGLQGETPCVLVSSNGCGNGTVSPFGPLSMVGKFTGNGAGSITFGEEDGAGVNADYIGITMTGSYTSPDSSGRGTLTFSYTGTNVPLAPTHYVYYLVGTGEMLLMSSDGHESYSMLSGDALAQSGTFSTSTLTGSYIGWTTEGYNGDGVSTYPVESGGELFSLGAGTAGQLTVFGDTNSAGQLKAEQSIGTISYTIDSNGRILAGGGNVIFYAANASHLFATGEPVLQGSSSPELITVQQQSGSGFSCSDLNGKFGLGTIASVVDQQTTTGEVSLTSGTGVETLDSATLGVLQQGYTQTSSCATDSATTLGRLTATTSAGKSYAVYTIVQGQRYVLLDLSGTTTPTVTLLEK